MTATNTLFIEPYEGYTIDCTQNLYISYLDYLGYDVRLLGACWPWEFEIFNDVIDDIHQYGIISSRIVNVESLNRNYRLELSYFKIDNLVKIWNDILELVTKQIPVVLGLQNYNPLYRSKESITVKNIEHSIMLLGKEEVSDDICFIDTMPAYTGKITQIELYKYLSCNNRLWYATINRKSSFFQLEMGESWEHFKNLIVGLKEKKTDSSKLIVYTEYFIDKLIGIKNSGCDIEKKLSAVCMGLWGWELGRKSKWLIQYLLIASEQNLFSNIEKSIKLIEDIDHNWILAFRLLFMASKGNSTNKLLIRAIEKMSKISYLDNELIYSLREWV